MKFGKVDIPELVDFKLLDDHAGIADVLEGGKWEKVLISMVGCAKWNRNELKNFYPKGIVHYLAYYSGQFKSIELNTTYYNIYGRQQIQKWRDKNLRIVFSPQDRFPILISRLSDSASGATDSIALTKGLP
ncbi:MAG: DUF72 domain-containing protein [Opitutales bacterium]|nr:DUF72 domain-containing protein [Opitutales bacterium]